MKSSWLSALFIALILILIFYWVGYTLPSVWMFIPGVIISYLVWLTRFKNYDPDPYQLLPLYLFALAIQLIHFGEEYLTGFTAKLPEILGQEIYPTDYWIMFNLIAYSVFILGGIAILNRIRFLLIIPIFFVLVGVIFNAIAHIGLAIYVGAYFPGLYSAIAYAILTPFIVKKFFL